MSFRKVLLPGLVLACLAAPVAAAGPFPSTYEPLPYGPVLIENATVLTGDGNRIENGSLLMVDGRIEEIGDEITAVPDQATVIDAAGRWVTPGLIDVHSHLGVFPSPGRPINRPCPPHKSDVRVSSTTRS